MQYGMKNFFNMKAMSKFVWIVWEKQIRNKTLSSGIDASLYELVYGDTGIKRYFRCIKATLSILRMERPYVVFAPNPSIVLTLMLLISRKFFGFVFVSDAHYGGIISYVNIPFFQNLLDLCNRSAELVIVTNLVHAMHVQNIGGSAFVLEDPLPNLNQYKCDESRAGKNVFFICSFDLDEPYDEVFKAEKKLRKEGFVLYVSGNYKKAEICSDDYPTIRFLGYAPEHIFYKHLFMSNVVIDLTNNENCLVCGAYEAMAACKPIVLSDTYALREYFTAGALFAEHNCYSIANAIKSAVNKTVMLKSEILKWNESSSAKSKIKFKKLKKILLEKLAR